jgi:hypothetical protein
LILDGAQQPRQRIGTDRYASLTRQPGSTFASSLQSKRLQQLVGTDRAVCIASQCTVEVFSEDVPRTRWLIAEPTPRTHVQVNDGAAPGWVERTTLITTVLPMTQRSADWARHGWARWLSMKNEATVAFQHDQDDLPTIRCGAKLVRHTDSPLRPTLALSSKVTPVANR